MGAGVVIKNKPVCFSAYIDCQMCKECLVSYACKNIKKPVVKKEVLRERKPRKKREVSTGKHRIKSDEKLNPALKEQVQELPSRFEVIDCEGSPEMTIVDTYTGRKTTVPIFAYKEVRKAIQQLFGI